MMTPAGGLNLTMDELTHSAYDLTSGVTRYEYRLQFSPSYKASG